MQTIQGILLGICFAGALGGIVHLLSPGGGTDRVLRFIITLFVLTSVAIPLRAVKTAFTAPTGHIRTAAAVEAVLHNAETAIRQITQNVLTRYGCPNATVSVTAKDEKGEVHAAEFVIRGVPPEKTQEIADEIFRLTGEMPRMETNASKADGR